jgi:hypothetical protein
VTPDRSLRGVRVAGISGSRDSLRLTVQDGVCNAFARRLAETGAMKVANGFESAMTFTALIGL